MKDETKEKLISIENDLYELRLLILLETDPQSCRYEQILFTAEQFLKLSNFISNLFPACTSPKCPNPKNCRPPIVEEKFDIAIKAEIKSFYPPEKLIVGMPGG